MKHSITSIVVVLVTVTLLGSIAGTTLLQQQASASCIFTDDGDKQFKSLTKDFEKAVLDAIAKGDPNQIPGLLDAYDRDVTNLCAGISPSP
jgi:tetraacyldisaccharide-1-P 4'-kinase